MQYLTFSKIRQALDHEGNRIEGAIFDENYFVSGSFAIEIKLPERYINLTQLDDDEGDLVYNLSLVEDLTTIDGEPIAGHMDDLEWFMERMAPYNDSEAGDIEWQDVEGNIFRNSHITQNLILANTDFHGYDEPDIKNAWKEIILSNPRWLRNTDMTFLMGEGRFRAYGAFFSDLQGQSIGMSVYGPTQVSKKHGKGQRDALTSYMGIPQFDIRDVAGNTLILKADSLFLRDRAGNELTIDAKWTSGGGKWGTIQGTITDQTDLMAYLYSQYQVHSIQGSKNVHLSHSTSGQYTIHSDSLVTEFNEGFLIDNGADKNNYWISSSTIPYTQRGGFRFHYGMTTDMRVSMDLFSVDRSRHITLDVDFGTITITGPDDQSASMGLVFGGYPNQVIRYGDFASGQLTYHSDTKKITINSTGTTWGNITGTITEQTDLTGSTGYLNTNYYAKKTGVTIGDRNISLSGGSSDVSIWLTSSNYPTIVSNVTTGTVGRLLDNRTLGYSITQVPCLGDFPIKSITNPSADFELSSGKIVMNQSKWKARELYAGRGIEMTYDSNFGKYTIEAATFDYVNSFYYNSTTDNVEVKNSTNEFIDSSLSHLRVADFPVVDFNESQSQFFLTKITKTGDPNFGKLAFQGQGGSVGNYYEKVDRLTISTIGTTTQPQLMVESGDGTSWIQIAATQTKGQITANIDPTLGRGRTLSGAYPTSNAYEVLSYGDFHTGDLTLSSSEKKYISTPDFEMIKGSPMNNRELGSILEPMQETLIDFADSYGVYRKMVRFRTDMGKTRSTPFLSEFVNERGSLYLCTYAVDSMANYGSSTTWSQVCSPTLYSSNNLVGCTMSGNACAGDPLHPVNTVDIRHTYLNRSVFCEEEDGLIIFDRKVTFSKSLFSTGAKKLGQIRFTPGQLAGCSGAWILAAYVISDLPSFYYSSTEYFQGFSVIVEAGIQWNSFEIDLASDLILGINCSGYGETNRIDPVTITVRLVILPSSSLLRRSGLISKLYTFQYAYTAYYGGDNNANVISYPTSTAYQGKTFLSFVIGSNNYTTNSTADPTPSLTITNTTGSPPPQSLITPEGLFARNEVQFLAALGGNTGFSSTQGMNIGVCIFLLNSSLLEKGKLVRKPILRYYDYVDQSSTLTTFKQIPRNPDVYSGTFSCAGITRESAQMSDSGVVEAILFEFNLIDSPSSLISGNYVCYMQLIEISLEPHVGGPVFTSLTNISNWSNVIRLQTGNTFFRVSYIGIAGNEIVLFTITDAGVITYNTSSSMTLFENKNCKLMYTYVSGSQKANLKLVYNAKDPNYFNTMGITLGLTNANVGQVWGWIDGMKDSYFTWDSKYLTKYLITRNEYLDSNVILRSDRIHPNDFQIHPTTGILRTKVTQWSSGTTGNRANLQVIGGALVLLNVIMTVGSSSELTICQIPEAFRPSERVYSPFAFTGLSSNSTGDGNIQNYVYCDPDGKVVFRSTSVYNVKNAIACQLLWVLNDSSDFS